MFWVASGEIGGVWLPICFLCSIAFSREGLALRRSLAFGSPLAWRRSAAVACFSFVARSLFRLTSLARFLSVRLLPSALARYKAARSL